MIAPRESPRSCGPEPITPASFVATITWSRVVNSRSIRPVISSLEPSEYTFAVSKVVMPASTASRKNGREASSVSDQPCPPAAGSP